MRINKNSIYIKLSILLLTAVCVSTLIYFFILKMGDYLMENPFEKQIEKWSVERTGEEFLAFKKYVEENDLNLYDRKQVNQWLRKHKLVGLKIYRENILKYDSNYQNEEAIFENEEDYRFLSWETYEAVAFADGPAEVILTGYFEYQLREQLIIMDLILSFLLFMAIVLSGIRKSMQYIRKLSEEIKILEGGALDYPITITGQDELTVMAISLEEMRIALRQQIERESYLLKANQKIVSELSHDMRTPLTAIILYIEILTSNRYEGDEQKEYIHKIENKVHQLKKMADHILSYSILCQEAQECMEETESFQLLFEDQLSELTFFLQENGFPVQKPEFFHKESVIFVREYIIRIMDNLCSNILKYAALGNPVVIRNWQEKNYMVLSFRNTKNNQPKGESTCIGLESVKKMMYKMQGEITIMEDGLEFEIQLKFKITKEENR